MFGFLLITAGVLAISYFAYWIAFYNPEYRHGEAVYLDRDQGLEEVYQKMEARAYEKVTVRSRDGIDLFGRFYAGRADAPLLIQFHGYRGNGIRDFSAVNDIMKDLRLNLLVVDQRAHGESGGNTMTFGILERYDCQAWTDLAADRFPGPIYLYGVSMGAATVLMASELDLPDRVAGIIADCPYSSPGAIIRKVCRDMGYPGWLLYPFAVLGALVFGRFCLWSSSPERSVARSRLPILLIHGLGDKFVPADMSRRIRENCASKVDLELFSNAGHAASVLSDPSRYRALLEAFMGLKK